MVIMVVIMLMKRMTRVALKRSVGIKSMRKMLMIMAAMVMTTGMMAMVTAKVMMISTLEVPMTRRRRRR
eukprot:1216928-Alexandrium_andersonii.AAC.1